MKLFQKLKEGEEWASWIGYYRTKRSWRVGVRIPLAFKFKKTWHEDHEDIYLGSDRCGIPVRRWVVLKIKNWRPSLYFWLEHYSLTLTRGCN